MKYYRVKKEFDQRVTGRGITLVANELYTKAEVLKQGIPSAAIEPVEISQRNTYWSFGCRFENK